VRTLGNTPISGALPIPATPRPSLSPQISSHYANGQLIG
jgi:hypothetical protein